MTNIILTITTYIITNIFQVHSKIKINKIRQQIIINLKVIDNRN
jgi:hypothetical protein